MCSAGLLVTHLAAAAARRQRSDLLHFRHIPEIGVSWRAQHICNAKKQKLKKQAAETVTSSKEAEDTEIEIPEMPPVEPDFWEGEQWEWVGQSAVYLIPAIAVLGLAVGFFASSTYDNGSTVYLRQPGTADDTVSLLVPQLAPTSNPASSVAPN